VALQARVLDAPQRRRALKRIQHEEQPVRGLNLQRKPSASEFLEHLTRTWKNTPSQ
jgi:hypothetical protein